MLVPRGGSFIGSMPARPALLLLLALTGCAEVWTRPGSTEAEGDWARCVS